VQEELETYHDKLNAGGAEGERCQFVRAMIEAAVERGRICGRAVNDTPKAMDRRGIGGKRCVYAAEILLADV
jgi:hypothetical protein